MKRSATLSLTFIVTILIGMVGTSRLTAQQATPSKTKGRPEKTVASPDFGPLSVAPAAVNPLKIEPTHPSGNYMTKPAFRYNREKVEVLARHITFPTVINQGEHMLSVELPNGGFLCLDAAFYAGRVQGLIWAIDRDTVLEHELHRTIDDAQDLFQSCLKIVLQEAFADQNTNGKIQLRDVKKELAERIQIIQGKLRKAQSVKIKGAEISAGGRF